MGVLKGPNSGGLFIRDFRLEDDGPFLVGYRDRPSAGHPSRQFSRDLYCMVAGVDEKIEALADDIFEYVAIAQIKEVSGHLLSGSFERDRSH
jgi:hypothetical protein